MSDEINDLVNKVSDVEILYNLLEVKQPLTNFQQALIALSIPGHIVVDDKFKDDVRAAAEKRFMTLAKKGCEEFINNSDLQQLQALKLLINQGYMPKAKLEKENVLTWFNYLSHEALSDLARKASLKYLSEQFKIYEDTEQLLDLINGTISIASFGFDINTARVDELIQNQNSRALLIQTLLIGICRAETSELLIRQIAEAKTFDKFKELMGQLGVKNVDWMSVKDFEPVQKEACINLFKKEIANSSSFNISRHKALIDAFSSLSLIDQKKIVTSPEHIEKLLHANDEKQIKEILGEGNHLEAILQEKGDVSQFKKIHNFTIARALSSFEPALQLDDNKVKLINKIFVDEGSVPPKYKKMKIDEGKDREAISNQIKAIFNIDEKDKTLERALGHGDEFMDFDPKFAIDHRKNEHILNAFYTPEKQKFQKLYELLLAASKDFKVENKLLEYLEKNMLQSDSLEDFFKAILSKAPLNQNENELFGLLKKELTASEFKEIKERILKEELQHGTEDEVKKKLEPIADKLKGIIKSSQGDHKVKGQMRSFDSADVKGFQDPSNSSLTVAQKNQLLKDYEDVNKNANALLERANSRKKELENLKAFLPKESTHGKVLVDEQTKQINDELIKAEADIEFYKRVIKNLSSPKGAIDKIQNMGKVDFGIKNEKLSSMLIEIEKIGKAPVIRGKETAGTKVKFSSDWKVELERIPKGMVRQYDYNSPQNSIHGQFTATVVDDLPVYTVPDKITKSQTIEFKVQKFPQFTPENKSPTPKELEQLEIERVEFAMAFATEFLTKANSKPTKDNPIVLEGKDKDELKYLWTAFVYLGKNNPNLAFTKDAVKVYSREFKPADELGYLNSIFKRMAISSLYNKSFETEPVVKPYVSALEKISAIKQNTKEGQSMLQKDARKTNDLFKEKIKDLGPKPPEKKKKEENDSENTIQLNLDAGPK